MMNDNIAKLLDRAEHYVDTFVVEESWSEYDRQYAVNEKFAELIIKECACLVLNGKYDGEKFNPTDEFHQGWNKALDAVAMGTKQYFGVEELIENHLVLNKE